MRIDGDWIASKPVRAVMRAFRGAGKRAYFVGGCVRNTILGEPVTDIDIATEALPEEVIGIAESAGLAALPLGIRHGSVLLIAHGTGLDVTTFRGDLETDGRHARVEFVTRVRDDALRRDLTINALYADEDGRVIDPLCGLPDLRARRVRFIGDARERIREDYLRILRFFRFFAWYAPPGSEPDQQGIAACRELAPGLGGLSRERVTEEVRKLLAAPDPVPSVAAMEAAGVLPRLLPDSRTQVLARLVETERAAGIPPSWINRLSALAHGNWRGAFRFSRKEAAAVKRVQSLAENPLLPAEAAYRYGRDAALGGSLVGAALRGEALPPGLAGGLELGSRARFPVAAADLAPEYSGRRLGDRLRELEDRWVASGFALGREELVG